MGRQALRHIPTVCFLGLVLFTASLSRSQLTPSFVGDISLFVLCLLLVGVTFWNGNLRIQIPISILVPIGALFALAVLHVLFGNFDTPTLAVWPFYTMPIAIVLITIVPTLIRQQTVFRVVSWFAALLGIIGMFVVFVQPIPIPILDVELSRWSGAGVPFPAVAAMRSIETNPNTAGILFAVGAFSSLYNVLERRNYEDGILLFITFISLYLTQSRGGLVLFGISTVILLVYRYSTPQIGSAVIGFGVISAVFLVVSLLIGPPLAPLVSFVSFTGRVEIWKAAISALSMEPAFNVLFGPGVINTSTWIAPFLPGSLSGTSIHGSYFYLLRFGVLGPILWIFAIWGTIAARATKSNIDQLSFSLLVGFAFLMIFENVNVFGTDITSVLLSLLLGYLYLGQTIQISIPPESIKSF